MDIGGHRFFSKSDRVMRWWLDILPLEAGSGEIGTLRYQGRERELLPTASSADPRTEDLVMLVRPRKSRIYFMRRFFDYPILLTSDTLKKMGLARTLRCGFSYLRSSLLPQRKEGSLEDFLINRFGKQLYMMFYKSYTEKVWGVPCHEISAEWGAHQRPVAQERDDQLSERDLRAQAVRQHRPKTHENFADREVSLSQVWSRTALGACRRIGF
jgi:protoporphyrinogen oxidase